MAEVLVADAGLVDVVADASLVDLVADLFRRCYRTAHSRWAGGENYFYINLSDVPGVSVSSSKAWSRNGKWSGLNARFEINIAPNWREHIFSVPGLATAGAMLTTHATPIHPLPDGVDAAWNAVWLVQSRGFRVSLRSGVIVRVDQHFFHARSLKAALAIAKRYFAAQNLIKTDQQIRQMGAEQLQQLYGDFIISINDSIAAGNCRSGTTNWIEKHFPGRQSATVREILEADRSLRVMNAVKFGIIRHMKKYQKYDAIA